MKKFIAALLLLISLISLTACKDDSKKKDDDPKDEMILEAIEELESKWEDLYDDAKNETDRYFEIKNTRVVKLKKTDIEEFDDVEYIVEFVLFTDYFGSAPYYSWVGISDSVVVYRDGSMEVSTQNLLRQYSNRHYLYDYSDIVKSVTDHGDQYNCAKKLK